MLMNCPVKDGSVSDSGYPTMPVLNTTSPADEMSAPTDTPCAGEQGSSALTSEGSAGRMKSARVGCTGERRR